MEVQFGPNSVDEPNILYKLQRKIKVFNTNNPLSNRGYNLVTCSSKYGVVFVGSPDGILCAYYLKELIDSECEPNHITVRLQEKPTHIAVSCDQELLAVTGGQLLSVFKVADFQNQNVSPSLTIKCDVNPSTFVSGLQWNPCIPDTIAIAFYDGTLLVSQVSTSQIKKVPSKARCLCWSPKGKQLVTGNNDGTLSQYKPDLTPAKTIPAPNLFEGSPVEALAVYWISTFQFAVVYRNAADNSRPAVTIVNTPKAGQPSCLNYEDICYSMGSNRPWYYYLQGFAQWNMIMSASSNGMEIATLGSADGSNWVQWCQSDEARPELPLTDKKQENYPVGVCIDTCAIHQLPWGENSTLPHMPLLHVVSQSGLLTIFNVIKLGGAPQVCTPPQSMVLPAAAMTSAIPGEVPVQDAPVQTPAPLAQPKPQNAQPPQMASIVPPQPAPPAAHFGGTSSPLTIPKPGGFGPPQMNQQVSQGFSAAPIQSEQKPVQPKPTPVSQLQTSLPQATAPVAPKPQPPPQAQENAALKAEQERINEMKANQELKNILINEVNDFQMELYRFTVKTRETQIKLQREIDSHANFSFNTMDTEQIKKECSLDDLRGAIVQLKLELVRACAVVAEARTHAEAKDFNQWTQADPLTTKRVASVKKLAYYVQTQLDQAQRALDYRWSEAIARDPKYNKPGQRMIRPILDDVYQPLVKQQEILGRQQAVLRTLRNTLNECEITPMFRSTSMLRSTPLKNKDPLSKLTKNILNMSIDTSTKVKEPLLSAQKLDALRDVLSNHKTVRIKPVNVEFRQHFAAMRQSYAKSLKEQPAAQPVKVKTEPNVPQIVPASNLTTLNPIIAPKVNNKFEPKQELVKQQSFANLSTPNNVPSVSPVNNLKPISGLPHVARTLFTDEPKQDPPKPTIQPQPVKSAFSFPTTTAAASPNEPSVLKDLLQTKKSHFEAKNDANTLMGQPICSPSSFSFSAPSSTPITTAAPSTIFASKPISGMMNMFNKFQPQPIAQEPKSPTISESKPQPLKEKQLLAPPKPSCETGEPEATVTKTVTLKPKTEKPLTNLFGMTSTPLSSSSNVPDVLKSTQDLKIAPKSIEKEMSKENVREKDENVRVAQKPISDKKDAKPLVAQATNKAIAFSPAQPSVTAVVSATTSAAEVKKSDVKIEAKLETPKADEIPDTPSSSASSIFAAGNAASPSVRKSETPDAVTKPTPETATKQTSESVPSDSTSTSSSLSLSNTPSAATIFGAAAASQPKITSTSQAGSIFAAAAASSPPASASTQGSIFGTASTAQSSVFGAATTQSVFSSAIKPSIFSTPTPASPTAPSGSIFASAGMPSSSVTQSEPQTSTPSVFGSSSTSSVFGAASPTPSSVFGTSSPTPSVFGTQSSGNQFGGTTSTPSAFTPTTQVSVFSTPTTTQSSSIFGSSAPTVFGGSGGSVFASQPSVFGAATTQPSVFGSSTSTTQPSVFSTTPTSQGSVFGTAPTSQGSVFGSTPTSQATVFASTPTTQSSVFGSTPTTQSSIFGSTPTTQPSVFGAATTSQASVFGATPASQQSVFGTAPTTQASVFGSAVTTTTQSGSIFGGAEANMFASASISTTSAASPTSGGSIFGGGGSSGSVFGSNNANMFGGKAAFGQSNPTAASIFGGGGATSFGQKQASNFWSGGNTTGEGGFGSTGFGQPVTTQASSIFGGSTGGSFSTPSPAGQAFGSPQPGGAFGGGDNKPSVFGSPQQQTSSAFGGSPVFGNKPAFGQTAAFGSPPSGGFGGGFGAFNKSPGAFGASATFGGSPSFGGGAGFGGSSPGKMFGGPAQAGFAQTQSNATFESLATQNTLTFGNLAQQSGQQPQPAPAFNTSPSFTGWRG